MKEEIGKWVVCSGVFGNASVYGKVLSSNPKSVTIDDKVGGWTSNVWDRRYVKFFNTEEDAVAYYNEHKGHDDRRWTL